MYIVLDSCTWFEELGLTSHLGAATRFLIRDVGAKLAIPEVVRHETKNRLVSDLLQHRNKASRSGRRVLAVMGDHRPTLSLPTPEHITERVLHLIDEVDVETIDVPISLEAARAAVVRATEGGFPRRVRDGIIWQNCLALLEEADVHLVTQDSGFYADKKEDACLEPSLRDEADQRKHRLSVHSRLGTMLAELQAERTRVVFDQLQEELLIDEVVEQVENWVRDMLYEHGLPLGEFDDATFKSAYPVASGSHGDLVVEVGVSWSCAYGEGCVGVTVFGLLNRLTDELHRVEIRDMKVAVGAQRESAVWPDEDAVWQLVRVDSQGNRVRLEPKIRSGS